MQLDYLLLGKGESAGTFNWNRVLEPYPLMAVNEAATLVPAFYPGMVTVIAQDWDPIRRLIAAKFHEPNQILVPTEYIDAARKARPDLWWTPFRLCDVPRGATACIAMHFMREWAEHKRSIRVGCIGMDAYFGGSTAYAGAFADKLKEPIWRKGDYAVVNAQITKWAETLNVDLIDLPAEVGA